MLKKMMTILLISLVLNLTVNVAFASGEKLEKAAKKIEKIKADIAKLGTGSDAKIEVKLRDKTKLKGYVTQVNTESFIVMDEKTATTVEVPYPNVKQVKGNNLSSGVKIAVGLGILLAIVVVLALTGEGF